MRLTGHQRVQAVKDFIQWLEDESKVSTAGGGPGIDLSAILAAQEDYKAFLAEEPS